MKKYVLLSVVAVLVMCTFAPEEKTAFSDIVKEMGYTDVEEKPFEVVEFTIPESFGEVYERYNNMLKENGYDLARYKGKRCKRYTYLIPSQNVRANIIVYNGEIIGGDVAGITLDGIMIPIKNAGKS